MTPTEAERLNSKYGAFYVTRYSLNTYRHIQVGKPHRTIQAALKAAFEADKRHNDFCFVDIKKPTAI